MRFIFSFSAYILLIQLSYAQSDTSGIGFNLKEVIISKEGVSEANEAFNFYRSSKISSTEEILGRNEGVNLIRRGAFGMEPTLRSYSAGQINVTLNGMKMYGACTDKMDPVTVYVEPGNLSRLEVRQGAGGSRMGSSIGGGLNMQMKEATFYCHKVVQLNVYSQFNTNNRGLFSGFELNTNSSNASIRLTTTIRNATNYRSGGGALVLHSGYKKVNAGLSMAYKLSSHHLVLADIIIDRGQDMGYPALPMDVKYANAVIGSLTHRYTSSRIIRNWESKIYYNRIEHLMDDTHRPETVMHMDMPGESRTIGAYTQFEMMRKKWTVDLRWDAHQAHTLAEMTMYPSIGKPMYMQTLPGNDLYNSGISVVVNYQLKPQMKFGGMVRTDYYYQEVTDTFGVLQWSAFKTDLHNGQGNMLQSANLCWQFTPGKFRHQITFGYGERLPTSNERIGFYLFNRNDGYDYIGQWKLKPEKAVQMEYEVGYKTQKAYLTVHAYMHQIRDYIYASVDTLLSPMTIGGRGVKFVTNEPTATVYGSELAGGWRISEYWQYNGNMRWIHARIGNQLPMQQIPPVKLVSTLRFQKGALQIQGEHTGAFQQDRINPQFGEQRTIGWNVFSLRCAWMFKKGKQTIQCNAAIENIFDQTYREHLDWGGLPRPGRNLAIGINYYLN